jgi:hypothetical protein
LYCDCCAVSICAIVADAGRRHRVDQPESTIRALLADQEVNRRGRYLSVGQAQAENS